MKLFFTDPEFHAGGVPRPGIPFLCDRRMELVAAPNRYLLYVATMRGRSRAPATWRTYGSHLLEFFGFLEDNSLAWDAVSVHVLSAWRDAMLERQCSRNTVNQRLRCVHAFYDWATRQGLLPSVPFSTQDIIVARKMPFLGHVGAGSSRFEANELTLRTTTPAPQFLRLDKAVEFLEGLTPRRVRLMGYLMLLTGMRREEVVALDYRVLPNPAGHDPRKSLPMLLDGEMTPTKGAKARTVMLPFDMAVALTDYFTFEWPKLLKIFHHRYGRETTRLFLSRYGEELSVKSLNHAFGQASERTGISCHPHMLRHTFGTYELLRMERTKGQGQALLWVRERMGHSSITVTERYIHAADLIRHDDVDGYQQDLCEALRHGHSTPQA
ncbi:MAG: tyrosine-type recombinase/integrase [Proteobacteria bacterium]|nr:tyrosine-type recombinase/integrase [Pseudomonadota bacterium]